MGNIKLNAVASYVNTIVVSILGLIVNPMLVRYLGSDIFGIWKACQKIFDISSAADGRATQALKWIIAHGENTQNETEKRQSVGAAIIIWMLWLPLLCLILVSILYFLPNLVAGIPDELLPEIRMATTFLCLNVILLALVGIPDAVLIGTNQGYRSTFVNIIIIVLSNFAMIVAARTSYGLVALGLIVLSAAILSGVVKMYFVKKYVRWWGVSKPKVADVKKILAFSNWTLVWSIVQNILISSEMLLLSYLSGPNEVSKYIFTSYVVQFFLSICQLTTSAITPKLGSLVGNGELDQAAGLAKKVQGVIFFIIVVSGSLVILLNQSFVEIWAGEDLYLGSAINTLIVINFAQLAIIRLHSQLQDVGLKIARKSILGIVSSLASLILASVIYIVTESIFAMFFGLLIGRLPLTLIFPKLVKNLLPKFSIHLSQVFALIIFFSAARFVSLQWIPGSVFSLLAAGVLELFVIGSVAFFIFIDKSARQSAVAFIVYKIKG